MVSGNICKCISSTIKRKITVYKLKTLGRSFNTYLPILFFQPFMKSEFPSFNQTQVNRYVFWDKKIKS